MHISPVFVGALAAGGFLIAVAAWRIAADRRRPASSIPLVMGMILVYLGAVEAVHHVNGELALMMGAGLLIGVLVPSVPVTGAALMWNGGVVMRREGVHASTVLPLLAGVTPFLLLPAVPLLLGGGESVFAVAGLVALLCYAYLGFLLVVYSVHALLYARWPLPRRLDAVIVLGAGLDGDRVTPLLAGRVDRAIDLARRCAERSADGASPLLVMSGGQGADEAVAEARAMARHAAAAGWEGDIREEAESTTTLENLRLSARLLEAEGLGADTLGREARVMVVTSDYHVLRAAALARGLGVPWQVAGAPTARYYVPTAFLREYVAWLSINGRIHASVAAAFLAVAVLAAFA